MGKIYRINAHWLLMLLLTLSFVSKGQINTPSGAIVPFGFNTSYGNGILPTNLPTGGTYGQSNDAAAAYNSWKTNYITSCGGGQSRVNFDTPSETVSEGIGYGMLLSAYAADQALFNSLYAYYKANSNGNGFMNWEINGCSGVIGANGATDADEDVAMALIIAYNQWPNVTSPYNYKTEATNMVNKISSYEIFGNQAVNGDGWGNSSSCRDISYQAPGYYREYGTFVGNTGTWNPVVTGAYGLITANANATTGLVTDWSDNTGVSNACNGSSAGTYGFDACRNPWRMATDVIWHGTTTAATGYTQCNKIAAFINSTGAGNVGGPIQQSGGTGTHNATFTSTFAMDLVGTSATYQSLMNQMYTQVLNTQDQVSGSYPSGYFGNTLRVLSLFVMSGNFWKPGTTSNQKIAVTVTDAGTGASNTPVPTTTTFNFEDVEFTNNSTNTATFTISNPGSKTLTISGTPLVTLSGAGFTITQPSSATIAPNGSETFTVKFAPTASGAYTGSLTITSNDPVTPSYTIVLNGTGTATATAPLMGVNKSGTPVANNNTPAYNWGYVTEKPTTLPANNPSSYVSYTSFNVKNYGTGPLNITGITATGTGYAVFAPTSFPLSVAAGATGTFELSYTAPTATGTNTGSITIASNDPVNPSYKINLSAIVATCAGDTSDTKVLIDYDANNNVSLNFLPTGAVKNITNPVPGPLDSSQTVMSYIRGATGTYDDIRYQPCTVAGGTFSLTGTDPVISMLIYAPSAGITVQLAPKTSGAVAVGATLSASTTQSGWNQLFFDLSAIAGKTTVAYLDFFIDPNATQGKAVTYYIDNIEYSSNPCKSSLSTTGIFDDFETNINVSLTYNPSTANGGAYNGAYTNPSKTGLNTSNLVAQYIRPDQTTYQTISYTNCASNPIILFPTNPTTGTVYTGISMLVYAPAAGIPIEMSLQDVGDSAIISGTATANVIVNTTVANQWEELYFDFSAFAGNTKAKYIVLFVDPTLTYTTATTANTYFFDNIEYSVAPCISGITTTGILDDFDNNQWINETSTSAGATYTAPIANPSTTGNSDPYAAEWIRPATGKYAYLQYQACKSSYNLAQGKAVLSMQIYSPSVGVPVTMQMLNSAQTVLNSVTAVTTVANAWQTLVFDQSAIAGTTTAAYMNIMIDTGAAFVTSAATRTYYIDNIEYAAAAPYAYVVANGTPVQPTNNVNFGAVNLGSTLAYTFTVHNDGSQNLILGEPIVSVTGTNATSFTIDTTTDNTIKTVSPGSNSSTSFIITFKPQAAGALAATLTIPTNDTRPGYGSYIIYLNGTGSGAKMAVTQGTTNIATAGTYTFAPSVAVGSSSSVTTFTISNSGNLALTLSGTSLVAISGTNAADFTVVQPTSASIAASGNETFTVTFKPSAAGTRTATLTIASNDPASPYVINLSGSAVPAIPTITTTTPTTFCTGGSVVLTANSTTTPVTYQWSLGGTSIAGATSATYTATTSGNYTVVVTNNSVNSAASTATTVTVNPTPATPTIAAGGVTTFCTGGNVTLTASDATSGVTYQWYSGGTAITGATATTYSATGTANYTVIATSASPASCPSAASTATSVTVYVTPSTPTIAAGGNTSFCSGSSVTLTASDLSSGVTYKWYNGGTAITGATATTYSASASGTYTVIATTTNNCSSVASAPTTVTVNLTPVTPTISGSPLTFCSGGNVTLTGNSPTSGVTYQWLSGGTTIAGATNSTYSATTSGDYTVTASLGSCSAISTGTTVTVNTTPATPIINAGSALTFCSGGSVTLTGSSATSGIAYQWLNGGTAISGATNAAYSANTSGSYTVTATLGNCSATSTNATSVTVNATPAIPTVNTSGATSFCAGNSVTLSTNGAAPAYQWYMGGTAIIGATNSSYIADSTGTYTVIATSGTCSSGASSNTTVAVTPLNNVSVTITGSSATCSGTPITFTANASGAGLSYQWMVNNSNVGTNSSSFNTSSLSNGDIVSCTVTSSNACTVGSPATSNTITETISSSGIPTINIKSDEATSTVCSGTPINFSITGSTFGGPGATYQWNVNGNSVASATDTSFGSTTLNQGDQVTCTMTSSLGCATVKTATSNVAIANVTPVGTSPCTNPAPVTITGPATVSQGQGGTVTYSISSPNPTSTYVWTIPAGATIVSLGPDSSSITISLAGVTGSGIGTQSIGVTETNSFGYSTPSSLPITVDAATTTINGPTDVNASQSGIIYYIFNPDAGSTYTWSVPTGATYTQGSSATKDSIVVDFTNVSVTGSQNVSVTETNGSASTTSSLAITVSSATGITTAYGSTGATVSPNPFNNTTTLNIASSSTTQLTIIVCNMTGITVYTSDAYSTNQNINLGANLESGMYLVQAIYNGQLQTLKIIKSE